MLLTVFTKIFETKKHRRDKSKGLRYVQNQVHKYATGKKKSAFMAAFI